MTISRRSFVAAAIAAIAGGASAVAVPVAIAALPARNKIHPVAADKVGHWLRSQFADALAERERKLDEAIKRRIVTTEEICKMFNVPVHMVEGIRRVRA